MNKRNIAALILIIISLGCLYPGLTKPILNIHIGAQIPLLGEFELFDRTQSVISGIRLLYDFDNNLVATLILLFSVVVPVLKAVILFLVLALKNGQVNPLTLDINVQFLRPCTVGEITVKAKYIKDGKTIAYTSAELFQNNKIVASATATSKLV